jgi:ABC-type transport system substrate-binding protein
MRKILILLAITLIVTACQNNGESEGPRVILDWQPTPFGERPEPQEVILPTPEPAEELPDRPEVPEAAAVELNDIPEMIPTAAPPYVFTSEANGFSVPYPSSWQVIDSTDQNVRLYDPALDVMLGAFTSFKDEETSYESMLDAFLDDENDFFGDLELSYREEITFAGDKVASAAMLINQEEAGDQQSVWLAYAEDQAHSYIFTAFGDIEDLEARQATIKAIISQVEPGGAYIYNLDREETLVMLGGDPIPRTLDPARQTGSAAGLIGLLYSGLVRLTPELRVEPDLAESWEISDDGTEYTFVLREDLKFQSGKPITAADFKYSWERAADPETDSTTVATYLGDILGVPEKLSGEAESIAGLEVIDDRTLKVTLDGSKPYFLLKLTYPTSFVIDEAVVDPDDKEWVFEPNSSGPYTLSEFQEETVLIFKRNENYHTSPAISNVIHLLYQIGSPTSLFESGEVDVVWVWGDHAKRVRQPEDELHDLWSSTTSLCTSYVGLNNTLPPMDDPNVRLAFVLAVDKEGLNELLNDGIDLVAQSILPPAMPGFSTDLAQQQAGIGYDPDAARAALAESAYAADLPPITFIAGGFGTTERDDLNALIASWQEELGAEISVEYLDPFDYTRAARENPGHLASYGWCADYPDPQNFLDVLFHSQSEFNVSSYSNTEVDALLEEARTELDPTRRLSLYQEIEAMLLSDVAVIPLDHGVSDVLVNPRVQGYVLSPMGVPIVHRLSLEPFEEGN